MLGAWRWAINALVVAVISLSTAAVWGQQEPSVATEAAKAAARQKYAEATTAFSKGDYKDAIDLFLQGDALVKNAIFAYNIASAFDAMGDMENALRWSREYLRRAPDAPDRAEVKWRLKRYQRHLARKGVQQVTIMSTPAGATLVLDGTPTGVTPWTGEIRPGHHVAKLRLRGYRDAEQAFELSVKQARDVSVALQPAGPQSSTGEPVHSTPDGSDERDGSLIMPLSLAAASLGVICLGIGAGLEVARAGAEQDVMDAADQITAGAHYDRAQELQLGARTMVGIGAAFAVAGAVVLTIDLASSDSAGGSSVARAHCGAAGCRLDIVGSF